MQVVRRRGLGVSELVQISADQAVQARLLETVVEVVERRQAVAAVVVRTTTRLRVEAQLSVRSGDRRFRLGCLSQQVVRHTSVTDRRAARVLRANRV